MRGIPFPRRALGLLTLASFTLLLSGCAALVVYTTSLPRSPEATSLSVDRRGFAYFSMGAPNAATLALDALELTLISRRLGVPPHPAAMGPVLPVLPVPYRWWPREAEASFYLEVQLAPREPLSFSPHEVVLRLPEGGELRPVSVIGPIVPEGLGQFFNWEQEIPKLFVPPGRSSCFVLKFERSEPLPWDFSVELRGIEASHGPVPAPAVDFERGSRWYVFWGGGKMFCAG